MLNIVFGRDNCKDKKYILDPRIYFTKHKKPEWFQDDFVRRFLYDIDGSKVLFEEALINRHGHGISTEKMSTGCKTLCCIYYDREGKTFNGSAMGDNCIPYYMAIARKRDVNLFYEHFADIESKYFEEGLIYYNGHIVSEYEFEDLYSEWCKEN
jgi:hypothetical protein